MFNVSVDSVCSFVGDYFECNPSSTDLGSDGKTINIDNSDSDVYYVSLPKSSKITSSSFFITPSYNLPVKSFDFSGGSTIKLSKGDFDSDILDEFIVSNLNQISLYNNNSAFINASFSYSIYDLAVTNFNTNLGDEILIASDDGLHVLSNNYSSSLSDSFYNLGESFGHISAKYSISSVSESGFNFSPSSLGLINSSYNISFVIPWHLNVSNKRCF